MEKQINVEYWAQFLIEVDLTIEVNKIVVSVVIHRGIVPPGIGAIAG